jgi:tetratricopeptide (TPR) repeat protein
VTDTANPIPAIRTARERYLKTGDETALAESVRAGRDAVRLLAGTGALEGSAALELSASLSVRYEKDGRPGDLDEAISRLEQAKGVLPAGHGDLPAVYGNMAGLKVRRFGPSRHPHDLEAAVGAARRGIALSGSDAPGLAYRYSNLTGALRELYQLTGESRFLDESISSGRKAVELAPPPAKDDEWTCMVLATLAGSLLSRAFRTLSADDAAEGITIARRAVASASPGSPSRLSAGDILAACLRLRFDLTGDLANLGEASGVHREMADLAPPRSPERALHLLQAAATLKTRFDRLSVAADLDEAENLSRLALDASDARTHAEALQMIAACLQARCGMLAADGDQEEAEEVAGQAVEKAEQARDHTDPSAPAYPDRLIFACNAKAARFRVTGTAAHRADAIAAYEDTLARLGSTRPRENGPSVQLCVYNLAYTYTLATRSGPASRADIDKALALFRHLLDTTVPGQRAWAPAVLGVLKSYALLVGIDQAAVDTAEAARLYRRLADAPAVPPQSVVRASQIAGLLLMRSDAQAAATILADAVRLLPAVAWRGIDRESRETQLSGFSGLASDAAASLIAAGDARDDRDRDGDANAAVEVVEQGRSILWADLLRLRRGDADLWRTHPGQAARLRDIAAALSAEEAPGENLNVSRAVDQRMALASEWEEIVAQVRAEGSSPGFLDPPRLASLLPAAADGPVVVVNVSEHRCDALLVTSGGTRLVPLPLLRADDVLSYSIRYFGAYSSVDRAVARKDGDKAIEAARTARERTLTATLEWLWDTVTEPVLTALGFGGAPVDGQPLPRVWWCPTGLLTLLPLHAAGHYENPEGSRDSEHSGGSAPRSVLDRVVSSYTPTVKALADARNTAAPDIGAGTLLFVGMPKTQDAEPLPGATADRDLLAGALGERCQILYGPDATADAVRAELPKHQSAHFSCHGEQNLFRPSEAGLRLHGGTLTIADLSSTSYQREFAFLSACKTATGGTTLPDEAISLAAALHYTGYRHVIATLWSVDDDAAAEIAEHVYGDLIADGRFVPAGSARALHSAVQRLRGATPRKPSRWIPFIHTGP